jgi:protein gp37
MGKLSSIQWCHSSANWQMGCEGCELWNGKRKICYAGRQTEGLAGRKGWPASFEQPTLFLDRVEPTLKWGPPTDAERDPKPWIPRDMPRLIFLNDMGDTFSAKLALNWMAPFLPLIAACESQFLLLTKRPSRLIEFADRFNIPSNLWVGTSVTSAATAGRIALLHKVRTPGPKFVSFEPMWGPMPPDCYAGLHWAIFGGESGDPKTNPNPTTCPLEWIEGGIMDAQRHGAKVFVKQTGARPTFGGVPFPIKDSHGGDWGEWPDILRVREFPTITKKPEQTALL